MKIHTIFLLSNCLISWCYCETAKILNTETCENNLPQNIIKEIDSYAPVVNRIINETMFGTFKGKTWQELADFTDEFGPRLSGTKSLEDAIDYVLERSKKFNLENVHGENVQVPYWVRGKESATLLEPRIKNIKMLGLGYSVGTPNDGITANAIVVESFEELEQRADEIPGKIVVYNEKYTTYGETVKYRSLGAVNAAKVGAVAVLIRSVTPFSIYSPHTGMMSYSDNIKKIPAACITIEDAELLSRMAKRGKIIKINIKMEAHQMPDAESRNVVAEIVGSSKAKKIVVVSGHIDSWDVGQGAMDDGGGAFISWNSLILLKSLNLRPKRTLRAIMWTAEEMGIVGADYYISQHKLEEPDLQFVMESDIGTFTPMGLDVTGSPIVTCILQRILTLLSPMASLKVRSPGTGPDIEGWTNAGVPSASLWNKNNKYFWFHHTEADTMTVENSSALDMSTAIFAATSYILADINFNLPHQPPKLN